ncbi:hypothetical protein P9A16_21255 [Shinella sp. 838]|uniref:hypothetical protein n=1 Tax=unclassified Shinella TaxID=2643062 RepID=UPI0003C55CFC|nr:MULTISPECIES: hypothetical protein [unclassified Shinella]EYR82812.1 hypothetical protein SHLA_18c000170 [Shinella sp. DD12]MCA0340709.1 hypothetical protein [Pseudomonadota bacterium]MDG4673664.1 hypothetical protein [Shinella sp. 838]
MATTTHDTTTDRRLEPRRLRPRRQPPHFPYDRAGATEIPRMAALAEQLQPIMLELQPMPDEAMDGINNAHTAVVEALAVAPVTKSSELADKLRVLAYLVESDKGGVLNLETLMLQAVLHDLGAFPIRKAIAEGFGIVETIYGDLLQLRAGYYTKIDRPN